jgi:hypothetical protein
MQILRQFGEIPDFRRTLCLVGDPLIRAFTMIDPRAVGW